MRGLPEDLLDRPAPEGARWIALVRLRELVHERKRLDSPGDRDAVHDFRVALRRLRSLLRAYRGVLDDSVPGRIRRALSGMAAAAGVSRDADVRLQWIDERRERIAEADRAAVGWVERQLRRDRRAGDRGLKRELERRFDDVVSRLQRRLSHYRVALDRRVVREFPATRTLISSTLLDSARALRDALAVPQRAGDARALHRARIAAKRLRYALEPVAEGRFAPESLARTATASAEALASLQDVLGRMNDAHQFRRWLRERAAASPPLLPSLARRLRGLRGMMQEETEGAWAQLHRPEIATRVSGALDAVEAAAALMAPAPSPGRVAAAGHPSRPT